MGDDEWDLYAVVRSCINSKNRPTTPTTVTTTRAAAAAGGDDFDNQPLYGLDNLSFGQDEDPSFDFPNLDLPKQNGWQELHNSCKPFLLASHNSNMSTLTTTTTTVTCNSNYTPELARIDHDNYIPIFSIQKHENPTPPPPPPPVQEQPLTNPNINSLFNNQQLVLVPRQQQELNKWPQQQQQELQIEAAATAGGGGGGRVNNNGHARAMQSQANRTRKKKANQKRVVVHIASDTLPSDAWAWRKYGQKPIKGSPHPRNYYRCSSTRGCSARKQVEKSSEDAGVYVVTYTGDHIHSLPTHRNSLAGSTRPKLPIINNPPLPPPIATSPPPTCSSPPPPPATTTTYTTGCYSNDTDHKMIMAMEMDEEEEQEEHGDDGGGSSSSPVFELDSDDEDYDDHHILIPNYNMAFVDHEDIIKGLRELGSFNYYATTSGPPFGDNSSTN